MRPPAALLPTVLPHGHWEHPGAGTLLVLSALAPRTRRFPISGQNRPRVAVGMLPLPPLSAVVAGHILASARTCRSAPGPLLLFLPAPAWHRPGRRAR